MSEEKFTISDDEVFEPEIKKKVNKKILIAIVLIIAIAILIIVSVPKLENLIKNNNLDYDDFNISGNIMINNGVATSDDEYIYYTASNNTIDGTNIYKVQIGTNNYETFYEGGYDIRYLNISDKYICFEEFGYRQLEDGKYDYDVKVHKKGKDGKNDEVIVDNDISYNNICIYVSGNYLYYVSKSDENIHRVNLENNENEIFMETNNGFITISNNYVIYLNINDEKIYAKEIDTDNEIKLTDGEMIYIPQVYDKYIYHLDENQHLNRISLENANKEIVNEDIKMYKSILVKDNVFYLDYKESGDNNTIALYKYDLKTSEIKEIKEMTQLGYINIVGNYVYNMNVKDKIVTAVLTEYNENNEIELQTWNYEEDTQESQNTVIENIIGKDV